MKTKDYAIGTVLSTLGAVTIGAQFGYTYLGMGIALVAIGALALVSSLK